MAKNYKDILNEAVALPLAIETKLPAGAPKISSMLDKLTSKLPNVPDAPFTFPDLPPVPTLPTIGKAGLPTKTRQEARTIRLVDAVTVPPRTTVGTPGGGTATFMGQPPTFTFK
jgi:hypothetical protein